MPFEEEYEDLDDSQVSKRLKKVSSQKSILDDRVKRKPTKEEFDKRVDDIEKKSSSYKKEASELALQFKKAMEDKTLAANKNVFAIEVERELLVKMAKLAIEINNDVDEQECMGSMGWIVLLLSTCFSQRDRINNLEYKISRLENNLK